MWLRAWVCNACKTEWVQEGRGDCPVCDERENIAIDRDESLHRLVDAVLNSQPEEVEYVNEEAPGAW